MGDLHGLVGVVDVDAIGLCVHMSITRHGRILAPIASKYVKIIFFEYVKIIFFDDPPVDHVA